MCICARDSGSVFLPVFYARVYMCENVCVYVRMCLYVHVKMFVHVCECLYMHGNVFVYVCEYICICM